MPSTIESEAQLHPSESEAIDRQLTRLLESHHFSRSTRYPALLQFLVQQVQMGNAAKLKERLIGIEVFHRTPNYDTNTDPIVRVTAAEVRKRIAQYYHEPDHSGELRIDLPIGSYVPRFFQGQVSAYALDHEHDQTIHPTEAAASMQHAEAIALPAQDQTAREDQGFGQPARFASFTASGRPLRLSIMAGSLVAVMLAIAFLAAGAWRERSRDRALHQLWEPMVAQGPLLLVIGDHSLDDAGQPMATASSGQSAVDTVSTQVNRRSQIPLEDVISLDKIHAFLTRDEKKYRDRGAAEATLEDLRGGPVVLYAAFDNRWSVQLSQQLPFRFVPELQHNYASVVEAGPPFRRWGLDFAAPVNSIDSDYGIVARYFDPMLEHNVLIVAGVGSMGTAAASEFVTEERFSGEIVKDAPAGWKNGNFEIVLGAPVIDGQAGPPRIIASKYW